MVLMGRTERGVMLGVWASPGITEWADFPVMWDFLD